MVSQKTAAEGSRIELSSDVKEEWILMMLSSTASGLAALVVFADAKTESSSDCTRSGWGGLLITPGELGGV